MSDFFEGRLEGARRLAILGVGSELRADDVAGLLVVRSLAKRFRGRPELLLLEGGTAPENLTGPILDFAPSHLVVVDCAEIEGPPGTARLFPLEAIGGLSSSTHSLPLGVLFGYLRKSRTCAIFVVGIRPKSLEFDEPPTKDAHRASRLVARELGRAIRDMARSPRLP